MSFRRRLIFLDGDRCCWRTERFMEVIYERLELHGISRTKMAHLKEMTEAKGGSFDTFNALRSIYDAAIIDRIAREVEDEAAMRQNLPYDNERCLLMPGARELMALIPSENRTILTRGGEEMQLIKLRGIAGIDTEKDLYEITDREDKARMLVESFVPGEEKFIFRWIRNAPGDVVATHATLVDDKAKAFLGLESLGDRANGYWYREFGEVLLPSQELPQGAVLSGNVEIIDSLYAVRDAIASLE